MKIRVSSKGIKWFSLLIVVFLITTLAAPTCIAGANSAEKIADDGNIYSNESETYEKTDSLDNDIELSVTQAKELGETRFLSRNEIECIKLENNTTVNWEVTVEKDCAFNIYLEYIPDISLDNDIVVGIEIDGESPFSEAANLTLPRRWSVDFNKTGYPFEKDSLGNDIRPEQVQKDELISSTFENLQGLQSDPYLFTLTKGNHIISVTGKESVIFLSAIKLVSPNVQSYSEYIEVFKQKTSQGDEVLYIQGEQPLCTSNKSIYPTYDKSNVSTVPSDPTNILLNTIGGANWANQGDSISWQADVEKAGLYRIAFRARQNVNSGLISYRKLTVNGEVPFEEAKQIPFKYSQGWQVFTLGNQENEYLLYLKPGDVITLSSTTGEMAEILKEVQNAVSRLNSHYREIIAITSLNPDIYYDYNLEIKLPDLQQGLSDITDNLNATYDKLSKTLGTDGSLASNIKVAAGTLEDFAKEPYTIPERLSSFKSCLETLGSIILSLSEQPLELDYIAIMQADAEKPNASAGFWKSFIFTLKQFLGSFVGDYSSVSSNTNAKKSINVWVSTGRDQAQIISNLISADFTEKTGIGVNISMVDTGATLIRASLAGKGPDAALMIAQGSPVELAARGALVDLTDMITDELYDDFHESSWTPFYHKNKIYALPESQQYNLIYYRKDIFEQLGINVPNTWDELYTVMEIIQSNNLSFGISEIDASNMGVSAGINIFTSLLEQRGGMFYTSDLTKTQFDTEIAYEAFTEWCRFYTDYGLERQFDFYSRFRTGEIPMAFGTFASYAQLYEAAPEIRGLWDIAPIPGTMNENGDVVRYQPSVVSGCVILKAAEKKGLKDEAFEFLKWWVSGKTQQKYSTSLEVALGVAGRYYSANLEAFENINWSNEEKMVIEEQAKWILNQPTVIGNYAVSRDLTSALREVIAGKNRPRRALMIYNSDINEEIERKREEFNLDESN